MLNQNRKNMYEREHTLCRIAGEMNSLEMKKAKLGFFDNATKQKIEIEISSLRNEYRTALNH